jgi:hypothetical protein
MGLRPIEFFFEKMLIREILKIENTNTTGRINLFKEGIFWRVYQKSAYLFIKQIKDLKALKKFYKVVNSEVVYAGFPDTILPQIQELAQSKGLQFEKSNEKHCRISGIEVDNGFEQWFQSLAVFRKINSDDGYDISEGKPARSIIQKIKNYPIADKTPLETVQFVAELQEQLTLNHPTKYEENIRT